MRELKIDPEFRDKVPPLSQAEFEQLEKNILEDGQIFEPLYTWQGFIVDGHNRYKILQGHPEIPDPVIIPLDDRFSDRYSVIVWMCCHQTGRRNLNQFQLAELMTVAYEAQKRTIGGDRKSEEAIKNQPAISPDEKTGSRGTKDGTVAIIAEKFGTTVGDASHKIRLGKSIAAIGDVSQEAKEKILSGNAKATKSQIEALRKLPESEFHNAVMSILNDKPIDRPSKKPSHNPVGYNHEMRKNRAEIEAIVADMYDPSTVPEFTIDFLIEDIQVNAESYVQMLRNTLSDRSTLLTEENRPIIADAIEKYVISEIKKVKELVER